MLRRVIQYLVTWSPSHLPALLAPVVAILILFGPALFFDRSFAFRDAGHYYYPLYRYTNAEWRAGRIPLWNPWENCGQPLAADATTAAFYPGQLLFFSPLPYYANLNIYITAHALLAAAGLYVLARSWQAPPGAAALGSLAYACGGSVLFQHCNVVYLVGAAWLPWSVWATTRLLATRSWRWSTCLGLFWALMILGGDPQGAYHAGLVALLQWMSTGDWRLAFCDWRGLARSAAPHARAFTLFALAAVTALSLAAVQVLLSAEYGPRSDRAYFEQPRSIYEGVSFTGWFGPPVEDTHHDAIYNFSLAPWRLFELLWPNCTGRPFPIHGRWAFVFPGDDQFWTPSLYFGLAPLLLAALAWKNRRHDAIARFAWRLAYLGVLASFGRFGLGWLLRHVAQHFGQDLPWLGEPTGGPYWCMVWLLPGYTYFRYPSKLLVVAALGASLLVVRGAESLAQSEALPNWRPLLGRTFALTLIAALMALVFCPYFELLSLEVPADELFGPLDAWSAWRDVLWSLAHTAVVAGLLFAVIPARQSSFPRMPLLLAITLVDLCVAQAWMLPTAPADAWKTPISTVVPNRYGRFTPGIRYTIRSMGFTAITSSHNRVTLGLEVDQGNAYSKLGLGRVDSVFSRGNIALRNYWLFLLRDRTDPNFISMVRLDSWEVDPPRNYLLTDCVIVGDRFESLIDCPSWMMEWNELPSLSPGELPSLVVIESAETLTEPRILWDAGGRHDSCWREKNVPGLIAFDVYNERSRLMVVPTSHDPNWRATLIAEDGSETRLAIMQANRLFMALQLPAGKHRVELRYAPSAFLPGLWISGLSWLLLATLGSWQILGRRVLSHRASAAER